MMARCKWCRRVIWFRGLDISFTRHHGRVSTKRTFTFCERCVDTRIDEIVEWWDKTA